MTSTGSVASRGSRGLFDRMKSVFATAPKATDKIQASVLANALLNDDGSFPIANEATLRAMPKTLRMVYAVLYSAYSKAEDDLRKSDFAKVDMSDLRAQEALADKASARIAKFADKTFKKIEAEGVEAALSLSPEMITWVESYETDPTVSALGGGAGAAAASFAVTGGSNPAATPASTPLNWNDLNSNNLGVLILGLADGLEYDRFDTNAFRVEMFSRKNPPTINELVTMCSTYIFVGNNSTRLTDKVKNQVVGRAALSVLNTFGVVRNKQNSKSVTLARIGIAFSPIVWALRNIYKNSGKLSSAGVPTTTPDVLQDVALGGVSQFMSSGDQIKDFLIKFNRVLFKFKEQKSRDKTSQTDMDEIAEKFYNVSVVGAKSDPILASWPFDKQKDEKAIVDFYNLIQSLGVGGSV